MSSKNDRLGGYTLQELLGAAPVTKSPKQLKKEAKVAKKASGKRGMLATVFGAPFRAVAAIVKLPATIVSKLVGGAISALKEIVKLPWRIVSALASPWRRTT